MKVVDLMIQDVITIRPDDSLFAAVLKMNEHDVRHLPVVEDDRLVGIITNRDIRLLATRLPEPDRAGGGYTLSLETRVGEAMTREPILIEPDAELDEVLDLFIEAKVGAVPVVTGDRELVGIIGYIDLLSILRTKLDALLGRDDAVSQATHI